MAYEYDRFEREEGGGAFLMGLLAGTVLGAGLGMLFAPKSGSELRSQLGSQISDQTTRLREKADQTYNQASDAAALTGVYKSIDLDFKTVKKPREATALFAAAGGLLLALGSALSILWLGRVV